MRCIPEGSITPTPPPASAVPAGMINVFDNSFSGNTIRPVRRTRVVLRRYFKIDRVYTSDNGNFISTKHFKNKVNVLVKFKSTQLTTRGLRGVRQWQMLFPIKHAIGKYSGNLSNFQPYLFTSNRQGNAVANRNWWAALLMNAYVEFNEQTASINVGGAPNNMKILLTNWGRVSGTGSTPMNYLRSNTDAPSQAFIQQFVVEPLTAFGAQGFNSMYNGAIRGFDMSLGYNTDEQWMSDEVKHLMFHELSHAAHFGRVGQSWWNSFVYSEAYAIFDNGIKSPNSPYGSGNDGLISDYIALGESWAEHMGSTITDRVYGANSSSLLSNEAGDFENNIPVPGLSSYMNYLEGFNPDRPQNPFKWIPEGLFNDLIDNRNEDEPVFDRVTGYTNEQLFLALQSDITSVPQYRQRLLLQTGNNQGSEVVILFSEYHY